MLQQTNENNAFIPKIPACTHARFFVKEICPPPPTGFNDYIALLYSSSGHCIQPEDGLNRWGRNM